MALGSLDLRESVWIQNHEFRAEQIEYKEGGW